MGIGEHGNNGQTVIRFQTRENVCANVLGTARTQHQKETENIVL